MKMNIQLFLACSCLAAVAGAGQVDFKIDVNRPSMVYALNEEAVFTVSAVDATGALVTSGRVDVAVDDWTVKPKRTRTVDLAKENPFVIRETMSEPGFLHIVLSGKDVKRTARGAGFAPERIRAAGTCPADFDAFWAGARAKLAKEVPLDPRIARVPERSTDAYDFYRISFATFGGQRVWGFLTVPKDKSKAPFPARVMISSSGKGRWTWDFECPHDQAGVINMSFTVHAFEPPTNQADADRLHEKLAGDLRAKYGFGSYAAAGFGVSREEAYFYRPILGIDRAVEWLWARPDVDRNRFVYVGGSQGGGLGMMLVGLNHRFTAANLRVPAMMDVLGATVGRVDSFPGVHSHHRKLPCYDTAMRNVAYYNGAFFASRVTCPMYFALGFIDEICPPTGIYAAYNELKVKDRRACHGLLRGHGWWPETAVCEKWLKESSVRADELPTAGPCRRTQVTSGASSCKD